ncbi:MAG: hypothetical protein AB7E80_02410 [Hyphomicrobiaceae bacterium]
MPDDKKTAKFVGGGPLMERAMQVLRTFQRDHTAALACPACGVEGVRVVDRSARPYAEWYEFSCATCGLEDAIHMANAAHRPQF